MFGPSRLLLVISTLASLAAAAAAAYTQPESRLASAASRQAELYARADPLNLFGLRAGPPAVLPAAIRDGEGDGEGGAGAAVLESGWALARGMKLEERQRTCADAGYGLCPTRDYCCPSGGQCCPGKTCCSSTAGTCTR
ncbi:hypothetical protein OC835_007525, partial [Tilletia horrida]